MKIALFTESYLPVVNGVTRSVVTLMEGLQESGHEAHVFAPGSRSVADDPPSVHRFPHYCMPGVPEYPLAIPYSRTLFQFIEHKRFDLIHIQTPFALGLCGLYLARRLKVPVVATLHTLYVEYAHYVPVLPTPLVRRLLRAGTRSFYNRVDAVVAPSPSVSRLLEEYGIHSPISVIATGVTMPKPVASQSARQYFNLPGDGAVLLYVGRLAREKNIEVLLKTFQIVHQQMPSSCLLILGGGPAEADMKTLAQRLGIGGSVIFAGFRSREDVTTAVSAADLFLFPSSTDTQAVSVVEAMALSVPPVVVNAYGPADIVEDGISGRVVASDAAEMAGAALSILKDPAERQRLGAGACRRAREFSTDATTAAMIKLYEDVLARSRSAGVRF